MKQTIVTLPGADGGPPIELLITTWIADPTEVDVRVADGSLWLPLASVGGDVRDVPV